MSNPKFEDRKLFFDCPELVNRFRQGRTNYDFPSRSISTFLGTWFVLEAYVENVKTANGQRTMLIISELSDKDDPKSEKTGFKFKAFSSSQCINNFLAGLRASGEDIKYLPLALKIIPIQFKTKKGENKVRYEFDTDL